MGNQAKALTDLNEALTAMPTEARILRARAAVHERLGQLILALSDIYRAVELTDGGDGQEATFAKAATTTAEQLLDALHRQARGALLSGHYPTAIAEFSEIVRHRPGFASAWLCRAVCYDANGRFDEALDDLNVALRLRPGPAQAFKLRSILHERRQDYAPALFPEPKSQGCAAPWACESRTFGATFRIALSRPTTRRRRAALSSR